MGNDDLVKIQFDYAWKWFSYHADQRTKMFNYMIVALGILAATIGGAIDKKAYGESIAVCFLGMALCLIFSRLDRRNEDLVRLAEDIRNCSPPNFGHFG